MATEDSFIIRDADYSSGGEWLSSIQSNTWNSDISGSPSCAESNRILDGPDSLNEPGQKGCDFLTAITVISNVYSNGNYIEMLDLNDTETTTIAGGKDFEVSYYTLALTTCSPFEHSTIRKQDKLIVKRMRRLAKKRHMTELEIALFVRELSVLHHLRDHANIVKLRGVGWFYDSIFDADLTPVLEVSLLVEEAEGTLGQLLRRRTDLSFQTEMLICRDIANGLLALHSCGIIHGDIKPDNVLVFPFRTFEGGKEVLQYKCKISDFSLARLEGTKSCYFDWGTSTYIAPERYRYLSPQEVQSTDVWSLGILFAAVTQRDLDLTGREGGISLGDLIVNQLQIAIECSTWTAPMVTARRAMFDNTLQHKPENRSLSRVVSSFESLFTLIQLDSPQPDIVDPPKFAFPSKSELTISYEAFRKMSGQIKDAIVDSLTTVSRQENDCRRVDALFELAVATISDFADPYASASLGLSYLRDAAELGHLRAQGLFFRAQEALSHKVDLKVDMQTQTEWLMNAAHQGHTAAIFDLGTVDIQQANRICRRLAARSQPTSPTTELDIHKAAAVGDLKALMEAAENDSSQLQARDPRHNVPLISAAMHRCYESVMYLLKAGASPFAANTNHENFLHYASHFSSSQLQNILSILKDDAATLLLQESAHKVSRPTSGLALTFLGTPLERAVAMGHADATSLFLDAMEGYFIPNGLILRRALLLAFQLHHVEVQRILIAFSMRKPTLWDDNLAPLWATRWESQGRKLTFLDAVVFGSVSRTCRENDVPLKWWRICHLGHNHSTAVRGSIANLLSLSDEPSHLEIIVDEAISLACKEAWVDSLPALLDCKADITERISNRLMTLRTLMWYTTEEPSLIMRGDGFETRNRFQANSKKDTGPDPIIIRPDDGEVFAMDEAESQWCIIEKSVQHVSFVDQIFFDLNVGTLLHTSINLGNRAMFMVLLDRYGADPSLPAVHQSIKDSLQIQLNSFSLLAKTKHIDLWFARHLQRARLQFSAPLYGSSSCARSNPPALYHALESQRYAYAIWLMRNGASLSEKITSEMTVLKSLLRPAVLNVKLLEFLFPVDRQGDGYKFLPADLKSEDGFIVFELLFSMQPRANVLWFRLNGAITENRSMVEEEVDHCVNSDVGSESGRRKEAKMRRLEFLDNLDACVQYLFSVYPNVPDHPSKMMTIADMPFIPQQAQRFFSVFQIPYKSRSLLVESIEKGYGSSVIFFRTVDHYQSRAVRNPVTSAFPRQTWFDLFFTSPMDRIGIHYWRKTALYSQYGYWPSLFSHDHIVTFILLFLNYSLVMLATRGIPGMWNVMPPLDSLPESNSVWEGFVYLSGGFFYVAFVITVVVVFSVSLFNNFSLIMEYGVWRW